MKTICGIDRITIEPETDSDRALLYLYKQREGQRITVDFDEFGEIVDQEFRERICLYIDFELITENEK